MAKKKSGNPANRQGGRITPKGTKPPKKPTMRVRHDPRMTRSMLAAVLQELEAL